MVFFYYCNAGFVKETLIAERFGVSPATLLQILNGKYKVIGFENSSFMCFSR